MGEKIELEALAEDRVPDLADAALHGRAGIRDDDVHAAEMLGDPVERLAHSRGIRHVAIDPERRPTAAFSQRLARP